LAALIDDGSADGLAVEVQVGGLAIDYAGATVTGGRTAVLDVAGRYDVDFEFGSDQFRRGLRAKGCGRKRGRGGAVGIRVVIDSTTVL
jgi:hypothetical protein